MVIQIAGTTLIDGPDRAIGKTMGPTRFEGNLSTPAQPRAPIRMASARPVQRGGSSGAISFGGVRLFASVDAARAWLVGHLASCPKGGTLTVTDTGLSASFTDAVVQDIRYRWQGTSVHLDYQIIHGAPSAT